jgi:FkbM family methyltransferase
LQNVREDLENKQQLVKKLEKFRSFKISFVSNDYILLKELLGDEATYLFSINKIQIREEMYLFCDFFLSSTVGIVNNELNGNEYDLKNINFKEGNIVIDIGLNVGMVSILLARKYPFLKIYSYEPLRPNYENFLRNRIMNGIGDGIITHENAAVTGDGRNVTISLQLYNSGGSRMKNSTESTKTEDIVGSVTLNGIFEKYNISKVKMLKIDCEGAVFFFFFLLFFLFFLFYFYFLCFIFIFFVLFLFLRKLRSYIMRTKII